MRMLMTRRMPDAVLDRARTQFDVVVNPADAPLTIEEAREALATYDAVLCTLGDGFSAQAFGGETRCRVLANFGVGYNHIDVDAARAAGVVVTNTPGAVTDATADIAMTLMLMTCRRAGEGERLVRADAWTGWEPTQMLGMHVSGKTVGIVGMGRIGQAIARRCHFGFGMEVLFYNRSAKDVDFPATQVADLPTLMERSDIVIVAVPGGAGTYHLIDQSVLNALRSHAVLINIARGDVIDEAALIAALQEGRFAGVGLDVYEREPIVPDALRAMENVTLLPHLGTAALEVREGMGHMALDNIVAMAEGEAPPNPV